MLREVVFLLEVLVPHVIACCSVEFALARGEHIQVETTRPVGAEPLLEGLVVVGS